MFKRKKNKKTDVNKKLTNVKDIIDYKVLQIDYDSFYSFSKLINKVDTITRSYEIDDKKEIVMGVLNDPATIDISNLNQN